MRDAAFTVRSLVSLVSLLVLAVILPAHAATDKKKDVHYNDAGFFDVHVCNWPGRPVFFLVVFSSFKYEQVSSVSVYRPDGSHLGDLDLSRYKVIQKKGKPEKRAFISEFVLKKQDPGGWYRAVITFRNGMRYEARDYVKIRKLGITRALFPSEEQELETPPSYIEWQAIPGARHYKLFIRDMWEEGKLVHESKLLQSNRYKIPKGVLKPGGWYSWKVHARDVNEDPELGDFNHGSLSEAAQFTILDK